MTIINFIEIDNIEYTSNNIKNSIKNNKPIEDKLNVVICCSNPCQYASRYILAREFIKRILEEDNQYINLYIVELAYKLPNSEPHKFYITDKNNKNHLQITSDTAPLWHKENLLNIAIEKLLPSEWKAVAWIDADIEFDNPNWALDTLKLLNNNSNDDKEGYDIVQLFSHALDLDANKNTMSVFSGFGYQYINKKTYSHTGNPNNQWHPGYAWAINRHTYDKLGGLFEYGILGAGDHHMTLAWIQKAQYSIHKDVSEGYKNKIIEYEKKCNNIKLGYTPGIIRHYYHGSKVKRFYNERWQYLINNKFDPFIHIEKNDYGLLVPTDLCPQKLLNDIMFYFKSRDEDEKYKTNGYNKSKECELFSKLNLN
jgi:hypothetical protein